MAQTPPPITREAALVARAMPNVTLPRLIDLLRRPLRQFAVCAGRKVQGLGRRDRRRLANRWLHL